MTNETAEQTALSKLSESGFEPCQFKAIADALGTNVSEVVREINRRAPTLVLVEVTVRSWFRSTKPTSPSVASWKPIRVILDTMIGEELAK